MVMLSYKYFITVDAKEKESHKSQGTDIEIPEYSFVNYYHLGVMWERSLKSDLQLPITTLTLGT